MKTCMLCGQPTDGSIGAAGFRWDRICQPCKDREDGALAGRIAVEIKVLNVLFSAPLQVNNALAR